MGKVFVDITMSLDGFVAAAGVDLAHPLGRDGDRLHDWIFSNPDTTDRMLVQELFLSTGAFVMGRRTFDVGERYWGDDGTFHAPCFVLTHREHPPVVRGPTTFTFVTEGIVSALEKAQAASGKKDVCVMGGAEIVQQSLKEGLVDEIRLHIANLLLGTGTRLFDEIDSGPLRLLRTRVMSSPLATHFNFRLADA